MASLGDPCRTSTSLPHLNDCSKSSLHSCTSRPSFILTADTCLGAARPLPPFRIASLPFLSPFHPLALPLPLCAPALHCIAMETGSCSSLQLRLSPSRSSSCERFLVLALCFHTLLLEAVFSLPCCQGEAAYL